MPEMIIRGIIFVNLSIQRNCVRKIDSRIDAMSTSTTMTIKFQHPILWVMNDSNIHIN